MEDRARRSGPGLVVALMAVAAVALGSSPVGAQVRIDVTNHNLQARFQKSYLDGDIVAVMGTEGPHGDDLNGDGDRSDVVAQLLDLSTGAVTNLRLAMNFYTAGAWVDLRGDLVAIPVSEKSQGASDLNGDLDAEDVVPVLHRISTGDTVSMGLEGRNPILGDGYLAFSSREARQNADLNDDGDLDDEVTFVFDARTGLLTNLMRGTRGTLVPGEGFGAVSVWETPGEHLNGDGDSSDPVLHIYYLDDGSLINVGVAARGARVIGDRIVFQVNESDQNEDLNGDGDLLDRTLHVVDARTHEVVNLGVFFESLAFGEDLLAFNVFEILQGQDLNGDGVILDRVMHLYDLENDELVNLEIVGTFDFMISGHRVAFRISERSNGEDFNGDGDTADSVMHIYDYDDDLITNLRLGVTPAATMDDRSMAFAVSEDQQGTDLNGDGVLDDEVLHYYDLATGAITNLGLVAAGGWGHARGRLAFYVPEDKNGYVDLNDDRNGFDDVLHIYDGNEIHNLRLQGRELTFDGKTAVFTVHESRNGPRDLNGDGDFGDALVHTATIVDLDATALIEELLGEVEGAIGEGEIPYGPGRSLMAELQVALWFLEFHNGETIAAIRIELFIAKVERLIKRGEVDPELGNDLLRKARTVLELLRNPGAP